MNFRLIISLIVLLSQIPAFAQTSQPIPSQDNRFSFPESIVCVNYGSNGEISIDADECVGNIECLVDFNYDPIEGFGNKPDPANPGQFIDDLDNLRSFDDDAPLTYAFTEPGQYSIAILIGSGTGNFDQLVESLSVLPATPPLFEVYNCSGNAVRVDITDTTFPLFDIDYDNDGTSDVQAASGFVNPGFAYPPAQTQATVSLRAAYEGCLPSAQTIPLVNGPLPVTQEISRLQVTELNEIDLEFRSLQDHVFYELQRSPSGPSSFVTIADFPDVPTFTDNSVNPTADFYCYRLAARDLCTNQRFYGNTICSHTIEAVANDGENEVTWETDLSGATSLLLDRNNTEFNPPFSSNGTYVDQNVICGAQYCYALVSHYGNGIESVSANACVIARSNTAPPALSDIAASIVDQGVHLDWFDDPNLGAIQFEIFRNPTHPLLPLATTTEGSFIDAGYQLSEKYCYNVGYLDGCGKRSVRSREVCPIELTSVLNDDNSIALSWSAYEGYANGIDHYLVEKYDAQGTLISSVQVNETSFTDETETSDQTFTYRILAIPVSTNAPQPSISNSRTIIKSLRLFHPTAFVPGSSVSANRTFSVKGIEEYIAVYEMRIFNRWGELMFFTEDMNIGWDGTFKGVHMPEGTYVFRANITDTAGRTFDYSGSVVLLRK